MARSKSGGILTGLVVLGGIVVVGLIAAFIYVNRAGFIRTHILPSVEEDLGEPISVANISFSVFDGIQLEDVEVGEDAWIRAKRVDIRYIFKAILGGRTHLRKVHMEGVDVTLTEDKLAELKERFGPKPKAAPAEKKAKSGKAKKKAAPAEPHDLWIRDVSISDMNLTYEGKAPKDKETGRRKVSLTGVSLEIPEIRNGMPLRVTLSAKAVTEDQVERAEVGKLSLELAGRIGDDLFPESLDLNIVVADVRGKLHGMSLARRKLTVTGNLERKQDVFHLAGLKIAESLSGTQEAVLSVNGTVGMDSSASLDLRLEIPNDSILRLLENRFRRYRFKMKSMRYDAGIKLTAGGRQATLGGDLSINGSPVNHCGIMDFHNSPDMGWIAGRDLGGGGTTKGCAFFFPFSRNIRKTTRCHCSTSYQKISTSEFA